jgi:hypothetical protein
MGILHATKEKKRGGVSVILDREPQQEQRKKREREVRGGELGTESKKRGKKKKREERKGKLSAFERKREQDQQKNRGNE